MLIFNEKWYDAIQIRHSRRNYLIKEIEKEKVEQLKHLINKINNETSGVEIRLINKENKEIFKGITGLGKIYSSAYLAFIGESTVDSIEEKIGYYGEMVILQATLLGLDTCWMCRTFNNKKLNKELIHGNSKKIYAMSPLGYSSADLSLNEKLVSSIIKRDERKKITEIYKKGDLEILSEWVIEGLRCVRLGPSTLNRQPWDIKVIKNKVYVTIEEKYRNKAYTKIDCGIAMLHFEIGAMNEGVGGKWNISKGIGEFQIV